MRILIAQHLDPQLRKGFENLFLRDLKPEIIKMTRLSIKSALKFYDDIHLYLDRDSFKYFNDLPVEIHELETNPKFFCGAKLEVLKKQKDLDFIWMDPDIFISTPFDINYDESFMVEKMTYLNDYYYKRNSFFYEKYPKYPMVREWLNSGLLWFRDEEVFNRHIELYEELMSITKNSIIVETWNISHIGKEYGYGTFQHSSTEYLHFDGYKKFYGVTKDMINLLENYL